MIVATNQFDRSRGFDADKHTCFGLPALELHDRYWASRRVRVVRRGKHQAIEPGPALFLLLEPDNLTFFDPEPVIRRLRAGRAGLARLGLRSESGSGYVERIQRDNDGRFESVKRVYGVRSDRPKRAWLTPSVGLAKTWALCASTANWLKALSDFPNSNSMVSIRVDATVLQDDETGRERAIRYLSQTWNRVGTVLPDVFEFQPGVWVHQDAVVDPTVRLVAPVWVGAGAQIPAGCAVVGPSILADAGPIKQPTDRDIDWGMLRTPSWRITPPTHRRILLRGSKRLFDIVFSLFVLACTVPFYPLIMLAIFLEDGWPPFFGHTRQTRLGKPFKCLKFRTMCRDADRIKQEILEDNEVDGPQFFVKDDPRVLRVGAILRRFQIDEFPQFINVLRGQMSIVGPRPSPDNENQYCPTWREMRLGVRPGLTGLWQVKRTREPETDFQEWIRYDLEYVQHQSWRMDIWIILQTIKRVIGG